MISLRDRVFDLYPLIVLWKKETKSIVRSPIFPILLILTICVSSLSLLVNNYWLFNRKSDLKNYFLSIPFLLSILIPMLTMNVWADEKKQHTDHFLLSLPISHRHIIYGKYTSHLFIWLIMWLITFIPPLSVIELLQLSPSPFFLSYVSIYIFGSTLIAISNAISFASCHSALNFIFSFLAIIFLNIVHIFSSVFYKWGMVESFVSYFSFYTHFQNASKGIFDSRDFLFYFALLIFALEANILLLKHDKK